MRYLRVNKLNGRQLNFFLADWGVLFYEFDIDHVLH